MKISENTRRMLAMQPMIVSPAAIAAADAVLKEEKEDRELQIAKAALESAEKSLKMNVELVRELRRKEAEALAVVKKMDAALLAFKKDGDMKKLREAFPNAMIPTQW